MLAFFALKKERGRESVCMCVKEERRMEEKEGSGMGGSCVGKH